MLHSLPEIFRLCFSRCFGKARIVRLTVAVMYLTWYVPNALGFTFRWQGILALPVLLFYTRLRWLAWISSAFISGAILYSFVGLRFGPPSIGIAQSVLNTSVSEAYEQSYSMPLWQLASFMGAILSLGIYLKCVRRAPARWWVWLIGIVLLVPTLQNGLCFKRFREQATYTLVHYREEIAALERSARLTPDWHITRAHSPSGKLHVIVVGESARADYFSAYGYPLPTSPFLTQHASWQFNNAISPATNTLLSVPRSLSVNKNAFVIEHAYDAVTLAKAAGLETWWLSVQGRMGFSDSGITYIASRSEHPVFLQYGDYDSRSVDDNELLPHIDEAIHSPGTRDKAIFVHTLGSHQDPCARLADYPRMDTPNASRQFNCYLTSIRKTDAMLERIDSMLKATQRPYEIIYFADHGVYLTNETMQHSQDTREAYHVPFVIIDSEQQDKRLIEAPFDMHHFIDVFAARLGIETSLTTSQWWTLSATPIKPIAWDTEHTIDLETLPSNPAMAPPFK